MNVIRSLASAARGALWLVRAGGLREQMQRLFLQERQQRWLQAGDLRAYERRIYSQNGEDGILQELFERIGTTNKFFVEIGAETGEECNCARLALREGWGGLFVEADDAHFARLSWLYRPHERIRCTHATVTAANVDQLLDEAQVPPDFDLLSIDIDGNDYWVWAAVQRWRPRAVVIEYNPNFAPPRRWVMAENPDHRWDGTSYHGASLTSLALLGRKKGYTLVGTDSSGVNAFFVLDELATPERFLDPALHYHYSLPNNPGCAQGPPPRSGPFVEI